MSSKDPTLKRMGVTLFLVVYVIAFNTCQAVLLNAETTEVETESGDRSFESYGGTIEVVGIDALGTVVSFVTFFFGGFLLAIAGFPLYMSVILTPIYLITLIGFWLLIFDYVKDIEILGSSV